MAKRVTRTIAGALLATAVVLVGSTAGAQRRGGGGGFGGVFGCTDPPIENAAYDGRFTFVRVKYNGGPGGCYYRGEPSWAHGYGYAANGTAESNLLKISTQVSSLKPHLETTNVIAIDDPALFKYPVAYMVEAGYLTLTDKEAATLRSYLKKGGFLIIDDSRDDFQRGKNGWANLEAMFKLVFPELKPIDMDPSHPIFHSFFDIPSFSIVRQFYDRGPPIFRGIFVDNDPKKRLMVMINFNTDISNYWEFSAQGFRPIDESNEAYKLGVNYLIYALTH
ncbi:MAG: DUF4159 domain-containing protein [Gemmatimonadaceae bacterium]